MTTPPGWHPDPEYPSQQRYWDGTQWTEHRAPLAAPQAPAQPPYAFAPNGIQRPTKGPFYSRWWFIVGCVVVFLSVVGGIGATGSSNNNDKTGSPPADISNHGTSNNDAPASKPTKAGIRHLNADGGHDNGVSEGEAFQLGDFKIHRGWKVTYDQYVGWGIKGLVVENTTSKQHDFLAQVKLFSNAGMTRVVANITCSTINETGPNEITDVTCFGNGDTRASAVYITFANTY